MSTPDEVRQQVLEYMDQRVQTLSQEAYLETMETIYSDLEIRIECVKEEIAANNKN